jgi:LysM repeat protein
VLLAALALILLLGAPGPLAPHSALPPTQPGASRDEGTFLVTQADDGSQAIYFIAQNARHSVLPADLQTEEQLNPLWPVRAASRQDVLAYPEGAPVGSARGGLLVAPAPAPAPAPPAAQPTDNVPAAPEPITVTLRPGDNLTHIAADYGTSVEAILAANGLSNANRIYAGQTLVIPSDAPAAVAEAPADTSTSAEAAPVAATPAEDAAAVADDDATAATASATYTVKRGDSAFTIARQFGVSIDDLLAANGIANPNHVEAGQVLTVPAGSS